VRGHSAVERAIASPGAGNVTKIALPATHPADAGATGQGFDGYIIQAFALFPRAPPEGDIACTDCRR
jgi:hypothetical protein